MTTPVNDSEELEDTPIGIFFDERSALRLASELLQYPGIDDDPEYAMLTENILMSVVLFYRVRLLQGAKETDLQHIERCSRWLIGRLRDEGLRWSPSPWARLKYFLWMWAMPWFLRPSRPHSTAVKK